MNELSRTVVSDFVVAFPAAPARRGASAAPGATRLTVRKSRRVVMEALRVCGRCDALGGGDGRQGSRACQGSPKTTLQRHGSGRSWRASSGRSATLVVQEGDT